MSIQSPEASAVPTEPVGLALRPEERLKAALAVLALGVAAGADGLSYERLKRAFREAMTRDPIDALIVMVLGCSYLFLLAEQAENPRCATFMDAVVFISTSLSVGYDDVFARTEAGKAIASFVMTFGPALAASALDRPAREPDASAEVGHAIVGRLDAILAALQGAA